MEDEDLEVNLQPIHYGLPNLFDFLRNKEINSNIKDVASLGKRKCAVMPINYFPERYAPFSWRRLEKARRCTENRSFPRSSLPSVFLPSCAFRH